MNAKHLGLKLLFVGAVCFAALFNLKTSPFRYVVPSAPFSECLGNQQTNDTYVYLYTSGLIPKGLMPYRDFFDHKGPLFYLFVALGIRFGRMAGVWLVESLFLFVSAFFAYKTARLLTSRAASVLAACLAVTWYSLGQLSPETLAIPFILAGLYSFVRYILNGCAIGRLETLGVGAAFAAVLLMKMNLISLWIVFTAAVIVSSVVGKRYAFLFERAAYFVLGAALVALPILAWLWSKGCFDDFVRVYLKFNLTDYGDKPPFGNSLIYFIPVIFRQTPQAARYALLYFCYNLPALAVYLFLFLYEKSGVRKILYGSLAATLLLSIYLIGAKGFHFVYYCYPMTADYLIFFAVAFEFILRLSTRRRAAAAALFLLLVVPILRAAVIPPAGDWLTRRKILRADPTADLSVLGRPIRFDRAALDLAYYIRGNTPPDARINGTGCAVYWYADRVCACPHLYEEGERVRFREPAPLTRFQPMTLLPARRSYKLTFWEDAEGNPPEYIFEQRHRNVRLGKERLTPEDPRHIIDTSPEIEARLAADYELVYQNEQFDLYRLIAGRGGEAPPEKKEEGAE
ncbi:MAG: hypothetical protein J6S42_06260 [Thermoguttaceae bacterium]|nr:hypothetical protein [Thermoguttaceae bacterium]